MFFKCLLLLVYTRPSSLKKEGRSNPYDALVVMYVHVEGIKSDLCTNQGDVLALDICDNWYVFSKAAWEKYKNDEV